VYGLTRVRLNLRPRPEKVPAPVDLSNPARQDELKACLMTFAGLNALYLAANAADLAFMWLQFKLPEGVTYSGFAHHGAYRLIGAVVLAAVTIAAFSRLRTIQSGHRWAKLLAYLFVAQNFLVLAGAARRLELYVDAYGLTRFRVAAALWLLLVTAGFVLLLVKLWKDKPFRFLLHSNTVAAVLLLTAVALADTDGFIADWNVNRWKRETIDLNYLGELDEGALPALARLTHVPFPHIAHEARGILEARLKEERELQSRWTAWTWRRARAIALVRATIQSH
jgi:hypothetical protein